MNRIISGKIMLVCLLAAMLAPVNDCYAIVTPNDPARFNRFYVGADKDFVGAGLDFSGVGYADQYNLGVNSTGSWATMISPSFFISAGHLFPYAGNTLYFHENNDPNGPVHAYEVAPFFNGNFNGNTYATTLNNNVATDLHIGKLEHPIPASDHIKYYPIVTFPNPPHYEVTTYMDQDVYVYGIRNHVARNNEFATELPTIGGTFMGDSYLAIGYNGNPDATSSVEGGDSGAPTFVLVNGHLALASDHFAYGDLYGSVGVDTLLSPFADFIQNYVQENSNGTEHITTVSFVPEPASLALLTAGGLLLLLCRRRRIKAHQ